VAEVRARPLPAGLGAGRLDHAVTDAFGFHALQLGLPNSTPCVPTACRTAGWSATRPVVPEPLPVQAPHDDDITTMAPTCRWRWPASFDALPFPSDSIDLVVLPHSLELAHDPHQMLREVERVLRPEGRLVIAASTRPACGACDSACRPCGWASASGAATPTCRGKVSSSATGACATGCGCWLRPRRRPVRLLAAAAEHRALAGALRLDGPRRRALVAGAGRGLRAGGRQAGAWHAAGGAGAPQGCARRARCGGGQRTAPLPSADQDRTRTKAKGHDERGGDLHRRRLQGQPRARAAGAPGCAAASTRRSSGAARP
jgi:SAM-dependent methyltransferase